MATRTPHRESLHIEIYVSREPGSLSVSSYSDVETHTIEQAMTEAEAFIATCRAMQADIAEHGLGAREARPPHDPNMSITISRAWDTMNERLGEGPALADNLFSSTSLFRRLTT